MNHVIRSDIKSLNNQLPALVATRTEINEFKDTVENYAKLLKVEGKKGVNVVTVGNPEVIIPVVDCIQIYLTTNPPSSL